MPSAGYGSTARRRSGPISIATNAAAASHCPAIRSNLNATGSRAAPRSTRQLSNPQRSPSPRSRFPPQCRRAPTAAPTSAPGSRSIFQDLSGLDLAALDPATSFLELGFDSLFLTQVAQQLFSTFALKITFRQLLENESSLDALAAWIADRAPAPAASVPISISVPTPSASVPAPPATRFRPITAGAVAATTPTQLDALNALIARYTTRTARSRSFTAAHRAVLADPRAAAGFRLQWKALVYPIVTARSLGARLWDLDGNEYIDVVNGYGPIMLGHSPPFVIDAVAAQLRAGIETGPQTALAGEVAELIADATGMDRVTFCNTGSEAVIAAFRLARTVTGRDKIVIFSGDYHGMFDEVLVRGVGPLSARRSIPIAPGIPRASADNIIVLDYGTADSLEFIRAHAAELAAVCVEPVQSRHPALVPIDFLRALRAITSASNTALIFDEVVTGFRAHPGGCQALFGIRADLATYGKVLGGGLPIGVLAGSRTFMDALDGGAWSYSDDSYPAVGVTFFAGTFVRHPLAMAAARAVLLHLKAAGPALQENLTAKTAAMVSELNSFLDSAGLPTRVETFASFAYFAWPAEYNFASLFYYWMRAKGIYIQESFPLFLTTAHTDADIAQIVRAFKQSVLEMQAAGLLPAPNDLSIAPHDCAPQWLRASRIVVADGAAHCGADHGSATRNLALRPSFRRRRQRLQRIVHAQAAWAARRARAMLLSQPGHRAPRRAPRHLQRRRRSPELRAASRNRNSARRSARALPVSSRRAHQRDSARRGLHASEPHARPAHPRATGAALRR